MRVTTRLTKPAVVAALATLALVGTGCSSSTNSTSASTTTAASGSTEPTVSLPTTVIPPQAPVAAIVAMVPTSIKSTGTLTVNSGASVALDFTGIPAYLATHPFLHEFYGTVAWGVRAVIDYYLGWFEGRASKLHPLPWREQARRLVELAGGPTAALARAHTALLEGRPETWQWALQLAEAVLYDSPDDPEARQVAASSARLLGFQELSANGRNYYLSEAARLAGQREQGISPEQQLASFLVLPVDSFVYSLPLLLDVRASDTVSDLAVAIQLRDEPCDYTVRVRRQVAELRECRELDVDPALGNGLQPHCHAARAPVNLTITTTAEVFKSIVLAPASLEHWLVAGAVVLEPDADHGGVELLALFASLFELPATSRA